MRNRLRLLPLLLLAAPLPAAPQTGGEKGSTATLPLEELLRLHDQAQAEKPREERPPVAASIGEAALSGRLLDGALDVTAQFKVMVLGQGWVRVPLMRLDPTLHVQSISPIEEGTVAVDRNEPVLVTREPGLHAIQLSFIQRARAEGRRRRAELGVNEAALAVLRLRFDPELFRLESADAVSSGEEQVIFPHQGRFAVEWEVRAAPPVKPEVQAKRPPVENVITSAQASVVCTLDGLQISRIAYALRLQGAQAIQFALPAGETVQRVILNGTAVPFAVQEGVLKVTASPGRAGDDSGRLELVLQGTRREFHLSGRLGFAVPAASWNTHELSVELHLPLVFGYQWAGGSLAPDAPDPPQRMEFADEIPTPGKPFRFRQQLISSPPDLTVDYTANLDGQYFRGAFDGGASTP
jgi:hypothetical protein